MLARGDRLSVAEWDAELARLRGTDADRPAPEVHAELRARFQQISQSVKTHNQSPHLGAGGIPALNDLRSPTLELMLLAHQELAALDQTEKATVPINCLDRLLRNIAARHAELESYLDAIQFALLTAELVAPTIQELLKGSEVPARRFRPMVEQLLDQNRFVDLAALAPLSAVVWDQPEEHRLPGWYCGAAIPAVAWTAAISKDQHHLTPHLREAEIMAALLSDIGQLVLSPGEGPRRVLSTAGYRRHPEISAAVIAGISDAAAEWSLIAGQHHERLDGTGFPRKLAGRQLGKSSRIVSVVVRWVEVLKTRAATSAPLDAIAAAATTLWKESLAGGFDAAIVKDLLAAIRPELPAAVQTAVLQGTRLKLDGSHPRLAGPHAPLASGVPKGRAPASTTTSFLADQN